MNQPSRSGIRAGKIKAENVVEGMQVLGEASNQESLIEMARKIQTGGISADEIVATNVVSGLQFIKDPSAASVDDIRRELEQLRSRFAEVVAAGAPIDADEADDVLASAEAAEQELSSDSPRKNRLLAKLRDVTEIITRAAEAATAAGTLATGLAALAPIAATIYRAASGVFGL